MTNLSRVYFERKKKGKKREREFFEIRKTRGRNEISSIVQVEFRTPSAWASNPTSWVGKKMRSAITRDSSFVELYNQRKRRIMGIAWSLVTRVDNAHGSFFSDETPPLRYTQDLQERKKMTSITDHQLIAFNDTPSSFRCSSRYLRL